MTDDPAGVYRDRAAGAGREAADLAAALTRVVNLRLLAFLAAAAGAAIGLWRGWPVLAVPAVAALAAFAVLVRQHGRLAARHRRAVLREQVNREALLRLARDWAGLPQRPAEPPPIPADHPYAADLDVAGRASLLQLLDSTTTPMGGATLAGWLLAPAAPGAIRERQAAVTELAPALDLREELQLLGRLRGGADPDPEPFLRWAESGRLPAGWRALRAWSWAGPALALLLAVLWLTHVLPLPLWIPVLAANAAVALGLGAGVEAVLAPVRAHQGALAAYGGQLGLLAGAPLEAALLRRLQEAASADGLPAPRQLARLDAIVGWAVPPASAQYLLLQTLFLWNVHVLAALERWRSRAGTRAREWLTALGELEALAALAGLAHAHPAWAFPELDPEAGRLEAVALGHPLIEPARRVDNDVTLGPPGTVLLVTGSNMSGKSTLLRALGTNAALAAAGAPVCAARLALPPLRVWTSMRVADSLEQGVSHFLAELRRLKQVVEASEAGGPMVCYLLDEVLQGTNTAERQIAARAILAHLAERRAIGAVSTHDLTLADDSATAQVVRHVHFRETIVRAGGRPSMTFDYRLRPGPATSTNALLLMELIGLAVRTPTRPT
ncbi:MAG TPA: DNA mismatch repair protein MutS [Candidatus Dormibacteraeota bacterium]|nr:DNA mismatch repair protein MutS [Candidatus Dormibacteraeota bacterium]